MQYLRKFEHFNFHKNIGYCVLSVEQPRDWNCRNPNVRLPLPLFFHNIAMTVQYLISWRISIKLNLTLSDIVYTCQISGCDNVYMIL